MPMSNSACCKLRLFKSKGVVLILVWLLGFFVVLATVSTPGIISSVNHVDPQNYLNSLILTLPFAGCLSDMCLSRYKMVRFSTWVLFISLVALNLVVALGMNRMTSSPLIIITEYVSYSLMILSVSGAMPNILQLGIDQLVDSSTSDIQAFVSWTIWTFSLANFIVPLTQSCYCGVFNKAMALLLLSFLGALTVASDFMFNHWLVKEPAVHSPLKLIYQVIHYAIKNKYPRLRSAFTYCEDKPYSRIDLGKTKYGGPFSTEEVEDVKTFFRVLGVTFASIPLTVLVFLTYSIYKVEIFSYRDNSYVSSCELSSMKDYSRNCFGRLLATYSEFVVIIILIPVLEFVIYPWFSKLSCFYLIGSLEKFLVSLVLILIYNLCFLSLKVGETYHNRGRNLTCFLTTEEGNVMQREVIPLDYRWLVIPQPISGVAVYLSMVGGIELVCAQSPYSMKGILIGCVWLMMGTSLLICHVIINVLKKFTGDAGEICGVWFYACLVVVTVLVILLQVIIRKYYPFRKRDETLGNNQIFAVNYFDKYLSPSM